jgi:hypothetical protein
MPEPSKQEIDARAYQLWEKPAGPKVGKMNFGIWLNKSCAIRTNPRQRAPLTRCSNRGTYSEHLPDDRQHQVTNIA